MAKLTYQGVDLRVECDKTDDCGCEFCTSIEYLFELLNRTLAVVVENGSKEHFNWLVMNIDGLFTAAREELERQQEERVVH